MRRYDRIKAVVSLDAIAHNFGEMKKNIAKGTKIIAVIKASRIWIVRKIKEQVSSTWGPTGHK